MKYAEYLNASNDISNLLSQPLTVEAVETILGYMKKNTGDDEVCHIWEKDLWQAALKSDDKAVREKALESKDIDFSRWFA